MLLAEIQIPGRHGRCTPAIEEAYKRYQEALAKLLTDVSLAELDSMLAFCGATAVALSPGAES